MIFKKFWWVSNDINDHNITNNDHDNENKKWGNVENDHDNDNKKWGNGENDDDDVDDDDHDVEDYNVYNKKIVIIFNHKYPLISYRYIYMLLQ